MELSLRRGLAITLYGPPEQAVGPANPVTSVGLVGSDFPASRTVALVSEGDRVAAGDALMRDRKRAEIVFTAPVCGRVAAITRDPQRRHTSLELAVEPSEPRRFALPKTLTNEAYRHLLLKAGLWASFTSRPFGRIPAPDSTPDAIFIAALDTHPLAVDARVVLDEARQSFERGCELIGSLTAGPVFICEGRGTGLMRDDARFSRVEISGPHPAGLVGVHVNRLFPLRQGRTVWQIHYQDVIAIGRLLETGKLDPFRVVSLAGPGVTRPRLIRVPLGADLDDIVRGELEPGEYRVLSGPPLAGRERRFLGRYHWQVTVLPRGRHVARRAWWMTAGTRPRPAPFVPTAALERVFAPSIPAVPLLRALSVGDSETAERLGCLALIEEDMALATYATGGAEDFGARLRSVLNMLEESR